MTVYSLDRVFQVLAVPGKILPRSERRFSWDVTNIGAGIVYYMRGIRGRDLAIAGEAQGVPIAVGATDGYDEEDAIDEVWIIAAAAQDVIVHTTLMTKTWAEIRGIGGSNGHSHRGEP